MEWIDINDIPITVAQATGKGQRYFSVDVYVKKALI